MFLYNGITLIEAEQETVNMNKAHIVKRTSSEHGIQYIAKPGIWQADINKAERLPFNEARWLAFTESTKRQPAQVVVVQA